MENFLEQFLESLRIIAWGNAASVRDLTLLPEKQARQMEKLSYTERAKIPETLLHRMFEHTAAENPDRTAIIASDRTLTYAALNDEANRSGASPDGVRPETGRLCCAAA